MPDLDANDDSPRPDDAGRDDRLDPATLSPRFLMRSRELATPDCSAGRPVAARRVSIALAARRADLPRRRCEQATALSLPPRRRRRRAAAGHEPPRGHTG
jgi:hypothetical protein